MKEQQPKRRFRVTRVWYVEAETSTEAIDAAKPGAYDDLHIHLMTEEDERQRLTLS